MSVVDPTSIQEPTRKPADTELKTGRPKRHQTAATMAIAIMPLMRAIPRSNRAKAGSARASSHTPSGTASTAAPEITKALRSLALRIFLRPTSPISSPSQLATTTASLARLNQSLPEVLGIERFAPSLVLEGTDPFEEDQWRAVKVGGARFLVSPAGPPRLPFGVELRLDGEGPVQLRAGQTLEIEL